MLSVAEALETAMIHVEQPNQLQQTTSRAGGFCQGTFGCPTGKWHRSFLFETAFLCRLDVSSEVDSEPTMRRHVKTEQKNGLRFREDCHGKTEAAAESESLFI